MSDSTGEQTPPAKGYMTTEQVRLQRRAAALSRWAKTTDRSAATRAAREAALKRFEDYPDPEAALKAHMTALALKSSRARRGR